MSGYITVLLQKSDAGGGWGFEMGQAGPRTLAKAVPPPQVVITQIDPNCVASELLEPGDRIIEIEGMETSKLSVEELQSILGNPSKRLSMVVHKKNPVKGNCAVKKTTSHEETTVEESREEVERKKEYEVVLEVDPSEDMERLVQDIRGKIQRGEKLDARELQITESFNKRMEQTSETLDSTRTSIQRDFSREQQLRLGEPPRTSELLKRKEKFLREQKKEEYLKCERITQEQTSLEERKKKSNNFWTDPPSDLKEAIKKNQVWQPKEVNEPITTSQIFSHLNDLHNTLRKTSAKEEKRKFWENCRKKYGWDPPGSKYDVSHRPIGAQKPGVEPGRSRSCEPERTKREDYRQTNPFFSPSPTNPFYSECGGSSQESLGQGEQPSQQVGTGRQAHRVDFNTKCEFFERQTSPVTSCAKNAQDLVSERLGTPKAAAAPILRKPSDFINDMQAERERERAGERRPPTPPPRQYVPSQVLKEVKIQPPHQREKEPGPEVTPEVTVPEEPELSSEPPQQEQQDRECSDLSEHKAFLGQSVRRQSASDSVSCSSEAASQVQASQETKSCKVERKLSMEEEIRNHPLVLAALERMEVNEAVGGEHSLPRVIPDSTGYPGLGELLQQQAPGEECQPMQQFHQQQAVLEQRQQQQQQFQQNVTSRGPTPYENLETSGTYWTCGVSVEQRSHQELSQSMNFSSHTELQRDDMRRSMLQAGMN